MTRMSFFRIYNWNLRLLGYTMDACLVDAWNLNTCTVSTLIEVPQNLVYPSTACTRFNRGSSCAPPWDIRAPQETERSAARVVLLLTMKSISAGLVALALTLAPLTSAVAIWGQCGGIGYTGSTSTFRSSQLFYLPAIGTLSLMESLYSM